MATSSSSIFVATVLAVLGAYTMLRYFRPDESYLIQIFVAKGLSNSQVYNSVMPWFSYCMLPTTLFQGLWYELFGWKSALIISSIFGILENVVVLITPSDSGMLTVWFLRLSEFCAAFGYALGFLVTAAMYSLLSSQYFQAASGIQSAAGFVGDILGSFSGRCLEEFSPDTLIYTVYGAVATATLALVVIIGAILGLFIWDRRKGSKKKNSKFSSTSILVSLKTVFRSLKLHYSSPIVFGWSIFLAGFLGIRTLVCSNWQSLFEEIDPLGGARNGTISGLYYIMAALACALLTLFPQKWSEKFSLFIIGLSPLIAGLLLLGMPLMNTIAPSAVFLICYYTITQSIIVIATALLGTHISSNSQKHVYTDNLNVQDSESEESTLLPREDRTKWQKFASYAAVFCINSVLSIIFQDTILLVIGPSCLNLSIRWWFIVFAILMNFLGWTGLIAVGVYKFFPIKSNKS